MNPDQLQGVVSQPISNPGWRFSFITFISIDHWSIPDQPSYGEAIIFECKESQSRSSAAGGRMVTLQHEARAWITGKL
jgi:hypothetical protein